MKKMSRLLVKKLMLSEKQLHQAKTEGDKNYVKVNAKDSLIK